MSTLASATLCTSAFMTQMIPQSRRAVNPPAQLRPRFTPQDGFGNISAMRSSYGFESRAYLLDVTDRCPNRRTMQELVDVLARFGYNEFYLLDAAKEREVPLDTAKTEAYCRMQGIEFRTVGEDFRRELELDPKTVSAPTFAARSLCGRIEDMRVAMERAEEAGRERKASRFVVTDCADGYAWHPLCVSLPGIVLGGNLMTAGHIAAKMDLEKDGFY